MPTKHRKQMIDQGLTAAHHGHDPRAVARVSELADDAQALLAAAAAARKETAELAEKALRARRAARVERHEHALVLETAVSMPAREARSVGRPDAWMLAVAAAEENSLESRRTARAERHRRELQALTTVSEVRKDPVRDLRKQRRTRPKDAWRAAFSSVDESLRAAAVEAQQAAAENAERVLAARRVAQALRHERERELRRQRRKKPRPV